MRKTIVSIGETLWDLLPAGPVLGGAPCNLAFRACSLGDHGLVVTRLGNDPLGNEAAERLTQLGMETRYVQPDRARPTGTVHVMVDDRGNPDFQIARDAAYDFIECTDELIKLAARADCFCFGTLIQRTPISRQTLFRLLEAASAGLTFLDLHLRKECHSRETIVVSLHAAEIFPRRFVKRQRPWPAPI